MNILLISHEYGLGGGTKSLLGVIDQLVQNHHVFVLVRGRRGALYQELKKRPITIISCPYYPWFRLPKPMAVHIWQCFKTSLNPICAVLAYMKLKKYHFDIIHSNSSVINIGAYLSGMLKVPHVWHIREFAEEDFQYSCVFPKKRYTMFEEYSDAIIVISKALYAKYQNHVSPDKLHLVYNGIDRGYVVEKTAPAHQPVAFLISGRIEEAKGQRQAIQAVSVLIQHHVENLHLYLAGEERNPYSHTLKQEIQEKHLEQYVTFLGPVKDMRSLREQMDVEIVCSRSEAFGRVTVEAMFAYNPVIASRAGANPELIRPGVDGELYEYGNPDDLAGQMKKFIESPQLVRQYGERAYKKAITQFTAEKNAQEIQNVYQEILSKNGKNK